MPDTSRGKTQSVSAVIAVRGHNTRLRGKNTLPFGDTNLLEHKINQLVRVEGLLEVVVSTEDDKMLEVAERSGVKAVKRPSKLADDSAVFSDLLNYFTQITLGAHLMWSPVTAPLLSTETYQRAIKTYLAALDKGFDSLISVLQLREYFLDTNGPLNFARGQVRPGTQLLPPLDMCTNGLIICPADKIAEWADHYGPRPYRFEVNQFEAIDIDTAEDYEHALALHEWKSKKLGPIER